MELVTGRLTPDQYEEEVHSVVAHFIANDVAGVVVTFGGGCDFSQVSPLEPVTIVPMMLASFIEDLEEREAYWMGASDLHFASDDGRMSYLLCEASDIHFYSDEPAMVGEVRERWLVQYPDAHENDDVMRRRRNLRGRPWRTFEQEEGTV